MAKTMRSRSSLSCLFVVTSFLACSDPNGSIAERPSGGSGSFLEYPTGGVAGASSETSSGSAPSGGGQTNGDNSGAGGDAASGSGGSASGVPSAPSGGSSGAGGSENGPFPASVIAPKIMIVGDSISAGPGCYKGYLDQNLKDNGYSRYEFVGEYGDDCGKNVRHSAVSCSSSSDFTKATFTLANCAVGTIFTGMAGLVAAHEPDLVMLQLGVNDVWGGSASIPNILDNYSTLLGQARANNPNIVFVIAQIQKIITDNCTNDASTANAEALIEAVPAWAAAATTATSPVFVADLWTNSDAYEAEDCVHPNDAGAQRMGLNWFNALKDILPQDELQLR